MKKQAQHELALLIERYPQLDTCKQSIYDAFSLLAECYVKNGVVLTCGNGGSAADSEHVVGELMKSFALNRCIPPKDMDAINQMFPEDGPYLCEHLQQCLPAVSLVSQTSLISAFANDAVSDLSFAQQVYGYACKNDALLAFSTSGNSKNVMYAAKIAKFKGAKVISFTGKKQSLLSQISDVTISVPSNITYQIQELHLPVYHAICLALEKEFFFS